MSAPDQPIDLNELNRFREMLNEYWATVSERANYAKEPNLALVKMNELYSSFGPNARKLCGIILSEWLESADGRLHSAAFALIHHFRITSAIPALKNFIHTHNDPQSAPERFELKDALRVLEYCTAPDLTEQDHQELR